MPMRRPQRGWTLLIVLIALAIVGYLARESLLQYFGTVTRSAGQARLPSTAVPLPEAAQAVPMVAPAVERARTVEDVVLQRAEQTGQRLDATR